jgi:hypothetical protein
MPVKSVLVPVFLGQHGRCIIWRYMLVLGFLRPFGGTLIEVNNRPQQLIDLLLKPQSILLDALPIMSSFSAGTHAPGYGKHLTG